MGILLLPQLTQFDDWIAQFYFNPHTNSFPNKSSFLFKVVLHDWARNVVFFMALVTLGLFFATFVRPDLRRFRRSITFIIVSMIITTSTIALIKYKSSIHCPYDLIDYGGSFRRVELLEWRFIDQKPGKCWPAGHASAGYCLLAFYFAARSVKTVWTLPLLIAALAIGFTFTISQTVRGAHFLSHGLWTGLIVWELNIVIAKIMLPEPRAFPTLRFR